MESMFFSSDSPIRLRKLRHRCRPHWSVLNCNRRGCERTLSFEDVCIINDTFLASYGTGNHHASTGLLDLCIRVIGLKL